MSFVIDLTVAFGKAKFRIDYYAYALTTGRLTSVEQ